MMSVAERRVYNQEQVRKYRERNTASYLLTKARRRASKSGLKFKLTKEDIKIPDKCPVLGIPLFLGGRLNPNSPTVDRVDNSKGYTPKNIMVISWRANMLKRDASLKELHKMAQFYGSM